MKFLEKDLEQIIYESDFDQLEERGLTLEGKVFRQKKIGNYGIADLLYVKKPYYHTHFKRHIKGEICVVELKQNKISVSAFFQALGYVRGIQRYLELRDDSLLDLFDFNITLIGNSICNDSTVSYLNSVFPRKHNEPYIDDASSTSIEVYTYTYSIDGIQFKYISGYALTNENLPNGK